MSEINNDECVHLLCDGKRCGLVIRNKELNKELCKYKKTPLWKMKIYLCEGPNGCKYYCGKEEYLRLKKIKCWNEKRERFDDKRWREGGAS